MLLNGYCTTFGPAPRGDRYGTVIVQAQRTDVCCNWFAGQLKDATSEQIKHGGCLGLGLAAMGTHRADVYEQLKFCLYQVPYLAKFF